MGYGFKKFNIEKPWWTNKIWWLILALAVMSLLWYAGGSMECNAKTAGMNVDARYNYFAGCLIRPQEAEVWVPLENYHFLAPE